MERLAWSLPLHLVAVLVSPIEDDMNLRYLLCGIRLLHSLCCLASRHSRLEQVLLLSICVKSYLLSLELIMNYMHLYHWTCFYFLNFFSISRWLLKLIILEILWKNWYIVRFHQCITNMCWKIKIWYDVVPFIFAWSWSRIPLWHRQFVTINWYENLDSVDKWCVQELQ